MSFPQVAAIYARKSTDQSGVADEAKSVRRQIEHSREYARRKGWSVDESLIFFDDGISGAEFANRPGFVRLMTALKPRPPFQVLIMSEESRLGREAIETAYALKQIITSGVRVFFYLEDRERTLDSPTDKILLSLTTYADELEREKARQRVTDAMVRKARAGHVTGGRVFGTTTSKRSARMESGRMSSGGSESEEAAVVRRIFEMAARGTGPALRRPSMLKGAVAAPAAGRDRQDGRHHRFTNCCDGPYIEARSFGTRQENATHGDNTGSQHGRMASGFITLHRTCRLFRTTCGPLFTIG
jgi:DNA invertase Pin-like site-specific DNA recombinase